MIAVELGELIKRKAVSPKARALCLIIGENTDNYTLYNLSLKHTQTVAKCVVEGLYSIHPPVDWGSYTCVGKWLFLQLFDGAVFVYVFLRDGI